MTIPQLGSALGRTSRIRCSAVEAGTVNQTRCVARTVCGIGARCLRLAQAAGVQQEGSHSQHQRQLQHWRPQDSVVEREVACAGEVEYMACCERCAVVVLLFQTRRWIHSRSRAIIAGRIDCSCSLAPRSPPETAGPHSSTKDIHAGVGPRLLTTRKAQTTFIQTCSCMWGIRACSASATATAPLPGAAYGRHLLSTRVKTAPSASTTRVGFLQPLHVPS